MGYGSRRKLDRAALPNRVNLDPELMQQLAVHDPGNLYAVPYLWTQAGLGYNIDKVRERLGSAEPDSWSLLFDPKNAAVLKDCGIMIVDSPEDVLLIYLGRHPNSRNPADWTAAADVLMRIRPYVRSIEADRRRSRTTRRFILIPTRAPNYPSKRCSRLTSSA